MSILSPNIAVAEYRHVAEYRQRLNRQGAVRLSPRHSDLQVFPQEQKPVIPEIVFARLLAATSIRVRQKGNNYLLAPNQGKAFMILNRCQLRS